MTRPSLLLACGALLFAAALAAAERDAEADDMPSLELLEYLAEFERDDDGHLLDPLDVQRDSDVDHARVPTQSGGPSR